jgi:hypothetical protein
MTAKLPVTLRSKSLSDNFNYKRLIDTWRNGGDYTELFLDNGDFAPTQKRSVNFTREPSA